MEGGGCVRNARCKKRAGLIGPDTKTTGRAKHQGGGVGGRGTISASRLCPGETKSTVLYLPPTQNWMWHVT